jgi:transketolase
LHWPYEEPFAVPPQALEHFRKALERGRAWQEEWHQRLKAYGQAYPEEAQQLERDLRGDLPEGWDTGLDGLFKGETKPIATRSASGEILNTIAPRIPNLIGGSADLAPSVKTALRGYDDFGPDNYSGRNLHFGVREHAMGAVASGLAVHGGIIPYTGTFLIFYDYMRPPIRLAAMMGLRVIYLFSHDSIGLGEDGPTHQPVEHIMGLRAVPNLVVIRPADAAETVEAWKIALQRRDGPTAILLSRQSLPVLDREKLGEASGVQRGGYVLWEARPYPRVIIIGTGSEAHIALEAGRMLQAKEVAARVVSLPSWELFEAQPRGYRQEVMPPAIKVRISVEAGSPLGWERYAGEQGAIIGLSRFGASAPGKVVMEKLGFTAQRVADEALKLVGGKQ